MPQKAPLTLLLWQNQQPPITIGQLKLIQQKESQRISLTDPNIVPRQIKLNQPFTLLVQAPHPIPGRYITAWLEARP